MIPFPLIGREKLPQWARYVPRQRTPDYRAALGLGGAEVTRQRTASLLPPATSTAMFAQADAKLMRLDRSLR